MNVENIKNISITDAEKDSLVDLNDVSIDMNMGVEERIKDFVRQIKNPYCFRVGDVIIKNTYTENDRSLNDCFSDFLNAVIK